MGSADDRAPRIRRVWRCALGLAGPSLLGLDVLGLIGFGARDRNVALALLLYFPLLPLGVASIGLDLARRGRSLRGMRFALAGVGLAAAACSGYAMIGRGPSTPAAATAAASAGEIRLLHWNVLWGGRPQTDATWAAIEDDVLRRTPDVVVLSEAPGGGWIDSLARRLGPSWSSTRIEHQPGNTYWFRMVALSRWPVATGRPVPIRNGAAVDVRIERPGRPIRLLIVDGRSRITQLRTPMLQDVAEACRLAAEAGEPFDFLAGDFNAVGRSLGFDGLRAAAGGYEPASRSSVGWRGSWPWPMPIYDIDHVWARTNWRVLACSLFASLASDHRGQLVRLAPG